MSEQMEPRYLGDAVYVSPWYSGLQLTTGHHEPAQAQAVIYLEPEVIDALLRYIADSKLYVFPKE